MNPLEEEISRLYSEPLIGGGNSNTYGQENIKNLVQKYHSLNGPDNRFMLGLVKGFSKSADLGACFVSVGVLHGLGMQHEVEEAYQWAQTQKDAQLYISHFDIGKSIADYLDFNE